MITFPPLTTSFASTGSATGRVQNGSRTTMASTAQLLPRPVLCLPCADPSWNHDAAQTFFPRLLNKVSSTATWTGSPAGISSATTSFATARPSSPASQRAREKNQCARSCGHSRARPAPDSIPHTVRFPGWARKPQASPQKVRNDGAVNSGAREESSVISDAGTCSVAPGSIGGKLVSQAVSQAPLMLPLHRSRRPHPRISTGRAACPVRARCPGCPRAGEHAGTGERSA